MPVAWAVALAVLVLFGLLVVGWLAFATYNVVVALQRRVDRSFANVEVALQQRHDELPNLVRAVRGSLEWERGLLEEVTRLRAAWTPTAPIRTQAEIAEATSGQVRQLLAVVEAYPALRSQDNVQSLEEEIERLETVIAGRRELYNEQVCQHNATIQQIPAVWLAPVFGWRPRPSFTASPPHVAAGQPVDLRARSGPASVTSQRPGD